MFYVKDFNFKVEKKARNQSSTIFLRKIQPNRTDAANPSSKNSYSGKNIRKRSYPILSFCIKDSMCILNHSNFVKLNVPNK